MCSIGNLWAVDPDYATSDWGADDFATVITDHSGITLFTSATAWSGNFSGTQYIALGGACDLSAESPTNYFGVKATTVIDSIEFYWAPNGTDASNIAWAAWTDANNAVHQDVDFLDQTASYTGAKSIEKATRQVIRLNGKNVKAIIVARQLKKAKLNGSEQSNVGKNKTVNILGVKVWLAPTYSVTYNLNGGTGEAPTQSDLAAGATFSVASADGITPPTNKEFDGWSDGVNVYNAGETYTMGSADVTLTAQWRNATVKSAIIYANLNGADNSANPTEYSEGVGIASFEPITRDGYVFTGWTPSSISTSATGAQTITANWLEAVDKIIYSWESDGTATEIGGTATGIGDATYVNYANSGYYTLRGADKSDFSGKYVQIDLSNNMITGDNILLKAYYTKDSDKDVAVKIADGNNNNATILTSDNLPNIYNGANPPSVKRYAVPSGISTNRINITRSTTATTAFIIKLQILRTVGLLSKDYNGVKVDGAATAVTKEGNTITLNSSYVSAPKVALIEHQEYNDDTNADIDVKVENFEPVGDFFVGTATVANVLYTVKVPKLASFTVTYMDDEETLGTENVVANGNPAKYASHQYKALHSFVGWYNNADLAEEHRVTIAEEVITADATYYGKWNEVYASSINIEQLVLDNGKKYDLMAQMGTLGYATNITGSLDSLDVKDDGGRNYDYLGLKVKQSGALLNFRVANGNTVKVKFGKVSTAPKVSINGGDYANMTITNSVYTYTADAEAIISIKTMDGDAVVFKQIQIGAAPEIDIVALPVKLGTNGWLTFAADYKYTVSGATVYKAAYNGTDAVVLTEVENAVVPANAGIILKGNEGELAYITESTETASNMNGNTLVGVVERDKEFDVENVYVIATQKDEGEAVATTKFYPSNVTDFPANKAYIVIASTGGAPAVRIIFAENNATDIKRIEDSENAVKFIENGKLYIQKNGVVYDVTGAKVR